MTGKRLLILMVVLLSVVTLSANVVNVETARQKAVAFMSGKVLHASHTGKRLAPRDIAGNLRIAESREAFHVFNIGTGNGFVIVSGDDLLPEILGYSYNGTYTPEDLPCNVRAWLKSYEEQYEYLKSHPEARLVPQKSESREPIAPMLECQWDQGSPYNDLCPKGCSTGCVATAMAQIMYYHKWPKQTTETIPSYETSVNNYTIPAIGITSIDWDNMLPTYTNSSPESSKQAVASLMMMCGSAVQMEYTPNGSGAYSSSAMIAFCKYFDYEKDVFFLSKDNYDLDTWNDIIYDEMKNKRPVLYSGLDRELGGHSFIVDGYDGDDYFHINWGWGGDLDGNFLLSSLLSYGDYTNFAEAIVNIRPTSSTGPKYYSTLANGTLTYRYDSDKEINDGVIFSPYYIQDQVYYDWEKKSLITAVVISPSFADHSPLSLKGLCENLPNLKTIDGLNEINTAKVSDMYGMFRGCSSLTSLDLSHFDTSSVGDMSYMFDGCSSLTSLDVSHFDTKNVVDMSLMFQGCSALTSLDVSHFDTSKVLGMSNMFTDCSSLSSLDVSGFDTPKVQIMCNMFRGCSSLTSLDVSRFNTSEVSVIYNMFEGCSNLSSLDVSGFNISQVKDMSDMFNGCSSLTSLDVSHFNTSNATNMYSLFAGCSSLTSLDVSHFDTSNVTDMSRMFAGCSSLTSLDVSHFDTSNVKDMSYMFNGCSGLTSLDVSNFNTSNVTNMRSMFPYCHGLTSLDLSHFNTSKVTDMYFMFYYCDQLTSLDISNFDTSNVKDMSCMFTGCSSLTSLDVSNFNTSNVKNMKEMFSECSSVTSLDVSKFNTSNVTNLSRMFTGCSSLASLDVSHFNTSNVINMNSMFHNCSALTLLDVSNFDTSNVTKMYNMFYDCSSLTSLDLSRFNTSKVTDMNRLFFGCHDITTIYASDRWSTENVEKGDYMFSGCNKLVGGEGTKYDDSNKDYIYARIDGGESSPGYFTFKEAPNTKGDVNGDGTVNAADIVEVVNYIMGNPSAIFDESSADLNGDGVVNAADIVFIVNIIMNTN